MVGVEFDDGTCIESDYVILGTGIKPNVQLFPKSALDKNNGGVISDLFM